MNIILLYFVILIYILLYARLHVFAQIIKFGRECRPDIAILLFYF